MTSKGRVASPQLRVQSLGKSALSGTPATIIFWRRFMDETKTQHHPEKLSRFFSEEGTKAWQQLEERVDKSQDLIF
jgi:hypothetical protein